MIKTALKIKSRILSLCTETNEFSLNPTIPSLSSLEHILMDDQHGSKSLF